jgi:hypothetical protein
MSNPGISKAEFAADSPLEGDGFEISGTGENGLTGGGNGIRTLGPPVPGGRLERAQRTEDGRWALFA